MKKNDVFLTIHGHFYQPPRENPWLESIEVQDSAAPFHDWNARQEKNTRRGSSAYARNMFKLRCNYHVPQSMPRVRLLQRSSDHREEG